MSFSEKLKNRAKYFNINFQEESIDAESLIKPLGTIDISSLLSCYFELEIKIQWTEFGHKGRQAGLQYKEGEDSWISAVGKSQGKELQYLKLNSFFKNTEFEKIINQFNLKKTRLMWVGPYACYSMHRDETPRVHIPLITNSDCYFVFKSGFIKYLELGNVHWVDTRYTHTFINCSDQHRLHLVGAVE
jgi:hypothetical protein